jgi:acyl-CoA synthetase (AMP-forming)/AMP-acid ligase II
LERKLTDKIPGKYYFIGVADAKWGEAVTLVVENANPLSNEQIADICIETLSPYERPKSIMRIQEIPLTSNGKLRRIIPKQF